MFHPLNVEFGELEFPRSGAERAPATIPQDTKDAGAPPHLFCPRPIRSAETVSLGAEIAGLVFFPPGFGSITKTGAA